jgi:phage terminase large subunit
VEIRISEHYKPNERQKVFHGDTAKYRLYGGAAGGGKSFALLWEAILQCLQFPGCNCLLLRREFTRLESGLIDHFYKYIPRRLYDSYNGTKHIVNFPNGSKLQFGHCQHEKDVRNYQGAEYLFIGFDELTEFSYPMWDFLKTRNRCPILGSFPCMAGATNPGGVGHAWVKALWIERHSPPGVEGYLYNGDEYSFTPAKLFDNPVYANDASYLATLQSVAPELRAAMLDGSWDLFAGQYFDIFDPAENVMSSADAMRVIQPWWTRWISIDWGFKHHCAIHWHARGKVNEQEIVITYRELLIHQTSEGAIAEEIAARNGDEKIRSVFLSPDAFAERTSANTIATKLGDVLSSIQIPAPDRADDDRVGGWRLMYRELQSRSWFLSTDCPEAIKALPLLIHDDKHVEDVKKTEEIYDDVADGLRYGLKTMLEPRSKPSSVIIQEALAAAPNFTQAHITHMKLSERFKKLNEPARRGTRR